MRNNNFIGEGVSFPFKVDNYKKIKSSQYENSIEESITLILSTKLGERLMRPDFGCRIHELLFAPNTIDTHNLVIFYVTEALQQWEDRIILNHIDVSTHSDTSIDIRLNYKIEGSNSNYNMVYPFYLTEYA